VNDTRPNVLWPIFDHEGRSVGIQARSGKVLCLFSQLPLAEDWLMDMGLEQHLVGRGLRGKELARFCQEAMRDNFRFVILDPPARFSGRVEMGRLSALKKQAVKRGADL
jgi:hypothetical protein